MGMSWDVDRGWRKKTVYLVEVVEKLCSAMLSVISALRGCQLVVMLLYIRICIYITKLTAYHNGIAAPSPLKSLPPLHTITPSSKCCLII